MYDVHFDPLLSCSVKHNANEIKFKFNEWSYNS